MKDNDKNIDYFKYGIFITNNIDYENDMDSADIKLFKGACTFDENRDKITLFFKHFLLTKKEIKQTNKHIQTLLNQNTKIIEQNNQIIKLLQKIADK
ncbi:MAG: hypothetical protein U0L85_04385 [Bacilli bacterium]|nr:hypothetical protein [Bacilli bacterium]